MEFPRYIYKNSRERLVIIESCNSFIGYIVRVQYRVFYKCLWKSKTKWVTVKSYDCMSREIDEKFSNIVLLASRFRDTRIKHKQRNLEQEQRIEETIQSIEDQINRCRRV